MFFLIFGMMLCTVIVLVLGVILMGKGGKLNKQYSTKLMAARVALQFTVIAILMVGIFWMQ